MDQIIPFIKEYPLISFAWFFLLVALIYMTVRSLLSKVKEVNRTEAIRLMNNEEGVVVDTRLHDAFKLGHIAGSIHLLPIDIKNKSLSVLEKHKKHPIIVACANGISARESASLLYKAGFEKTFILKEGINGWNSDNLPLVKSK